MYHNRLYKNHIFEDLTLSQQFKYMISMNSALHKNSLQKCPLDLQLSFNTDTIFPILILKGCLASLVGIGDHPINMNSFLRLLKPFSQIEMDKSWEMEDTTISNVPVLIYRPKYLDKGEKRTGVVYIHGGGWVFGAPGKCSS